MRPPLLRWRAAAPLQMIEVERKFAVRPSCEEALVRLGASLATSRAFTDAYFDNGAYELTLRDHWLRQRDGAWQLKFPPATRTREHVVTRQYAELAEPAAILERLRRTFGGHDGAASVEDWLRRRGCERFAAFTTCRKVYVLKEMRVDLDVADFGYSVGEVELVVQSEGDVPEAVERVDSLCALIASPGDVPPQGKLEAYMLVHCPDHFDRLVSAGVLGRDASSQRTSISDRALV